MNITLTKNLKSQNRIKYIDLQYYYIKKFVTEIKITIKNISDIKILVNKIIKKLNIETFKKYLILPGIGIK